MPMAILIALFFALMIWYYGGALGEEYMIQRRVARLKAIRGSAPASILQNAVGSRAAMLKNTFKTIIFPNIKEASILTGVFLANNVLITVLGLPFIVKVAFSALVTYFLMRFFKLIVKRNWFARLRKELPGTLDLIVICVEAGLGINSALQRVVQEVEGSALGKELRRALNEINAGLPLEGALKNLADRTELVEMRSIVAAIIQGQKMGTSLGLTFRVQAEYIREKYKMEMREKMAKVPVKILFPLVFFIFPILFVIILAPAMIRVSATVNF